MRLPLLLGSILATLLTRGAHGSVDLAPGAVVDGSQIHAFTASAGFNGESLVVWRERTSSGDRLRASVVRHDEASVHSEPFAIFEPGGFIGEHAVAFSGDSWLVVWHWWRHLYAVRISRSGEILGPEPFVIGEVSRADLLLAASSGREFLIAWRESDFRTVIVSLAGVPSTVADLDTGTPDTQAWSADLASDGRRYLLVWTEAEYRSMFPGPTSPTHLHGIFLDRHGVSEPLTQRLLIRDVSLSGSPGVTSSGSDYLVMYRAEKEATVSGVILAAEDPLTAQPPIEFAPWAGRFAKPAWDGRSYLIAIGGTPKAQLIFVRLDRHGSVVRRLERQPLVFGRSPQSLHIAPGAANDEALIVATENHRLLAYRESEIGWPVRRRAVR